MEQSNEELIALYVRGNENAFEELTRRNLTMVYSFALRFTGSEYDAEDITQETFVKVWRNIHRYKVSAGKFTTWLMRIARNTAVDKIRKKKQIPFSTFETAQGKNILEETVSDTELLAEEMMIRGEDEKDLQEAITTLPPSQRDVLLLHYTNRLTFEEIGKILKQPTNTVKSRHYRALIILRKLLDASP